MRMLTDENRLVFAKGGRGEYEEDGLGVWH